MTCDNYAIAADIVLKHYRARYRRVASDIPQLDKFRYNRDEQPMAMSFITSSCGIHQKENILFVVLVHDQWPISIEYIN